MTIRYYLLPAAIGLALVFVALDLGIRIGDERGIALFAASFACVPLAVGLFEYQRIPTGRWWIAPLVAAGLSAVLFVVFTFWAISQI
ncbi:hypothetical protein [Croceicoccus bisphenolivorans]|uniref:hypothetical protein n=1 Tax=Croceicoccus bisphenolivorans TaxID=1783232 RepID=UPI00082FA00A|nr:hypothetical protein [Croceicoccus bisphenolivorans]